MVALADFEVLEKLGQGSQGVTWRARHRADGRLVALKELRLGDVEGWKAVELFEREAEALSKMDHPDIPDFVGSFSEERDGAMSLYLAQELIEGVDLRRELAAEGRWGVDKLTLDALSMLEILAYLHDRVPPLVHRDIKPGNIIRRPDGRLCLVDFGAVQVAAAGATGGSTVIGTPGYMPMEQLVGQAEPRSDLYALGVLLGHLWSGVEPSQVPLRGNRLDFAQVLPEPRAGGRLLRLIEALCAPDREARPASARAALAMLRTGRDPDGGAPPESEGPQPREHLDAGVVAGRFAGARTLVSVARRRPRSYWTEVRQGRIVVVDRPLYRDESLEAGVKEARALGFEFVERQSRFRRLDVTTVSLWRGPDGAALLCTEDPAGGKHRWTLVEVFEDGSRVEIEAITTEERVEGSLRSLAGAASLKVNQERLARHVAQEVPASLRAVRGLTLDQWMLLRDPAWFGLEEPLALADSGDAPEAEAWPEGVHDQEASQDWLAGAVGGIGQGLLWLLVLFFVPIVAIAVLPLLPFILFLDNKLGWHHLLQWRAMRRELREGRTPAPVPMPELVRPDAAGFTLPAPEAEGLEVRVEVEARQGR